MRIRITKGQGEDSLQIARADGSVVATRFAHKGPLPHDFVHFAVEQRLGLNDAFWGKVASGRHPEELADLAKAGGHASAKRGRAPDAEIVEMVQAERLVECFEAEFWSNGEDADAIRSMAAAGWVTSQVPPLLLTDEAIGAIRADLRDFAGKWGALAVGSTIEIRWTER